jgi:hypothetical protein
MNSIYIAMTSLIVSFGSGFFTYFFTKKRDKEINKNEKEIENLRNELEIKKDEKNARQDYEYEARKRLYQKFDPLLFQFNELGENSLKRIRAFARESRNNKLIEWLSNSNGYYFTNSIYRLIAPLSVFKLMQEELTIYDMNLVPKIRTQYYIIKSISHTLSHDFKLANAEPRIPYDPHSESNSQMMDKTGRRTQGFVQGKLDQLVDIFIVQENINNVLRKRLISYGEFENLYPELRKSGKLNMAIELFSDFHPQTKPILWRILITQAILYNSILILNYKHSNDLEVSSPVTDFTYEEKMSYFDWRSKDQKRLIEERKILEPFIASVNYLKEDDHLRSMIEGKD